MKLQLVITADELGIDPHRDEGIFHAWSMGALTHASLMITGPSARSAAARARIEKLPLGLHLDLTETWPVAPPSSVASLLAPSGNKRGKLGLRDALAREEIDLQHVAREAQAQLLVFAMMTGKAPTHVDGHQHVHCVPRIAQVLAPLFARAGVRTTRIPNEAAPPSSGFYRMVSDEAAVAREIYAAAGVRSTEAFAGLNLMGTDCSAQRLAAAVKGCTASSLEVMCHVGHAGVGHDAFNESEDREHELAVYCGLPFARFVSEGRVELASFAAAASRGALR